MISVPNTFPFTQLRVSADEELEWVGYNPTFHRFRSYGLAATNRAFYVCAPAWILPRWKRYPYRDISNVALEAHGARPCLQFLAFGRAERFSAPFDLHSDEGAFDRVVFEKAVELLLRKLQ